MTSLRASLLLSTYEMPRHLDLVLAGLERQSVRDFEVLLCDDGSGKETRELFQAFLKRSAIPGKHLWQENQGFRKCKILNEGLRVSSSEVIIALDGDCIPHPQFIEDHLNEQEEGFYLAGRRVELGPKISATLTADQVRSGALSPWNLRTLSSFLSGDSQFWQRLVRIPFAPLRRVLKMDRVTDLKGCNYSVARKHLLEINGFDEQYQGYGREDTDVEIRLLNLGLKIKSMKGLALQCHVWHPRREFTPGNDDRLEKLRQSGVTRCEQGLA